MILNKMREKRAWSQEQLAEMSGLSVRTIQRIEAGNKASLESLKSLASVFEVNVSTLEQEITVIDKSSEKWFAAPFWFKMWFVGSTKLNIPERKFNIWVERLCVFVGVIFLIASPFDKPSFLSALIWFSTGYLVSLFTRAGDIYDIW